MANDRITPLVMPKWGLSMKEGKLAAWHVEEGQVIRPGQEIMDVETDKISNAVEATDGGLLRRKLAQVGEVYQVKALLGVLAPEDVSESDIDAYIAAFQVPVTNEDAEDDLGPVYQHLETASGRLRYVERPGHGNPIIFIHGFGGDLNNWLFNIDAVSGRGPVYALDLPGHGGSTKRMATPNLKSLTDSVEQFMISLGLTDAHLVGHSMGGAVAISVALRGEGRVKSLTLINSAGLGEEINTEYIEGFVSARSRRELKLVVELLFANPDLVNRQMLDDLLKYKRLDGVQDTLRALANTLFANGKQSKVMIADLAASGLPVQIIWGAKDRIIPPTQARSLARANTEVIADVGHMAQMEAAGRVNQLILAQFDL